MTDIAPLPADKLAELFALHVAMGKLRAIADPTPPLLPGFTGLEAFAGSRPPVRFIVTRDHDGQIELSLSLPGPKRPTEAHARAFLRWLGVEPVEQVVVKVHRHFVLRRGTVH